MCLFVETVMIEDGEAPLATRHNERLNKTRAEVFASKDRIDILEHITVSSCRRRPKCRIVDGAEIETVTYSPYTIRPIESLKIATDDRIEYHLKSVDRSPIDELFAMRGHCDDILIIRDGLVTDTSIANVAFFDGGRWHTPQNPLLAGVRRSELIAGGYLDERNIKADEIKKYRKIALFNAMIEFGEIVLPVDRIEGI